MEEIKMKTLILMYVMMITLVVLCPIVSFSQDAEQLFQKGIIKEEGEGSLRDAIELYKSVADNPKADRSLRAKALYQMGNCYEKLGQQEARGIYEKLVTNYGDQKELVANAKRKLSKLHGNQSAPDNSGIVIRQIASPGVDINAYSPDGQYATYNDWDDPEIGAIELRTGKKWFITKDGNWYIPKMHYPLFSFWSPDSKQIVYDWNIEENGKDKSTSNYELHTVNRDGSNDRTLIRNGNKALWAADWSPDGNSILCTESIGKSDTFNIVIISLKGGSKKMISNFEAGFNINLNFTNDGNFIVFRARSKSDPENYDLFIVSKDGGDITPLITNKEDDGAPFRVSGSNQFVYFSNHSGTKDLWCMTIENGKIKGNPKILKSDFDQTCNIVGTTADGTIIYRSKTLNPEIYKSKLDFTTKQVDTKPITIKRSLSRKILSAIWSPGFNYLAGLVETPYSQLKGLAPLKFVIQNVQTGNEYEFSPDLSSNIMLWWTEPQWSHDEKSILIKGENKEGIKGMYQIDVQSGKVSPYQTPLEHAYWEWRWLQFSPNGETQYFVSQDGFKSKQKMIARSVRSGEAKTIKEFDQWVDKLLLSPDGKTLVIQQKDTLWYMPSDGTGAMKKIDSFKNLKGTPIGWSADNKTIFVAKNDAKKGLGIWSISFDNESPKELFKPEQLKEFKGAEGLKISQVGNDVYLTMLNGERLNEYWAMENIVQK
jgi:Tol biopolymer transport system component